MILKPAPGRAVRFPGSFRVLPEEGQEVYLTAYWRRRLAVGDVVEVTPTPSKTSYAVPASPLKDAQNGK